MTGNEGGGRHNPMTRTMTHPMLQELLEAGVHFGHQTRRWNPKMRRFIFAERSGIYLIDLQKTMAQLQAAQELLRGVVMKGDGVLFVCTKKQLKQIVKSEAERCGAFHVTERWLGGTLTNFQTITRSIARLKQLEDMKATGKFEAFSKKEVLRLDREMDKLNNALLGIKGMEQLPGAVFIIDPKKERIAVREAQRLAIPVVAVVDTNCDPDEVDFPIPGNDDAIRAIRLITARLADAVMEGRGQGAKAGVESLEEQMLKAGAPAPAVGAGAVASAEAAPSAPAAPAASPTPAA
jgi:small subunit ribosomal protein S2